MRLAAAAAHLPGPAGLLATARTGRASLVLDLSGLPDDSKSAYLNRLPERGRSPARPARHPALGDHRPKRT